MKPLPRPLKITFTLILILFILVILLFTWLISSRGYWEMHQLPRPVVNFRNYPV